MKYIKKFKLFESNIHQSDLLEDGELYKDLDFVLYDELMDNCELFSANEINKISKFFDILFNKSQNYLKHSMEIINKQLYFEVDTTNDGEVLIYVSKLDDEYFIIEVSKIDWANDDDGDSTEVDNFLCDGFQGIKKWCEKGYSI
jgi:hypothetical protein